MKAKNMTNRERVRQAVRGEQTDRIPFTVYWLMLPRSAEERALRNAGLTVVERVPLYHVEYRNVSVKTREYYQDGVQYQQRLLETPIGTLSSLFVREYANNTSWWQKEYYIKTSEDYRTAQYIIKDKVYREQFDAYRGAVQQWGDDGYVMGNTEYSPMNMLIYDLLGVEQFSIHLIEEEDQLFSLYETIRTKQREMFSLCGSSPAEVINYCGNISQEVAGLDRFVHYYLPCINEFADVLHENGKLASCHYDAKMRILADEVAHSQTDIIEAFTPLPDGDLSVGEVRTLWKGKTLWINFPSSVLLEPEHSIEKTLEEILLQAGSPEKFLVGITEDVPASHWRQGFAAINRLLASYQY